LAVTSSGTRGSPDGFSRRAGYCGSKQAVIGSSRLSNSSIEIGVFACRRNRQYGHTHKKE
jgi:hypothetical protein